MRVFFVFATSILLLACSMANADDRKALRPEVQNGVELVSGGVGAEEQAALKKMQSKYNVHVTLSEPEGAYLSGVTMEIETDDGTRLVQHTTRGPIFLAQLQPGRYTLHAHAKERTAEHRTIDIGKRNEKVRVFIIMAKKVSD